MGLDWIAQTRQGDGEFTGMCRGKAIAYDPNIIKLESFDVEDCYGDEDNNHYMTEFQREEVIKAIKELLKKPSAQIIYNEEGEMGEGDDEEYEEWEEFFEEALEFLENNKIIWCWY